MARACMDCNHHRDLAPTRRPCASECGSVGRALSHPWLARCCFCEWGLHPRGFSYFLSRQRWQSRQLFVNAAVYLRYDAGRSDHSWGRCAALSRRLGVGLAPYLLAAQCAVPHVFRPHSPPKQGNPRELSKRVGLSLHHLAIDLRPLMNLPQLPERDWPSAICVFHRNAIVIVEATEIVFFPGSQTHNVIFNDARRIFCRRGVHACYIGLAVSLQNGAFQLKVREVVGLRGCL